MPLPTTGTAVALLILLLLLLLLLLLMMMMMMTIVKVLPGFYTGNHLRSGGRRGIICTRRSVTSDMRRHRKTLAYRAYAAGTQRGPTEHHGLT